MLDLSSFYNTNNGIIKQTILSLCVSMSYFCIGLVRGYSAPAVPSMMETNPELLPNKDIASWASAIPPSGAFIGSLMAGPCMHNFGRKYTILIAAPIWIISWMIIANAPNWEFILSGRMISGFCVGLVLPSAQIYVSECTDPKIRGVIGSFPSISMSAGVLTAYILGTFITWDNLAWTCCGVALSLTLAMIAMPRSPVWLRSKNRYHEADMASAWLGLESHTKSTQLVENGSAQSDVKTPIKEKIAQQQESNSHSWKVLMSRPILMPLAIGLTLLVIQQLSGIDSIIFFTVDIFRASGSSIDGNLATIMVGLVQLVSNMASLLFVDKLGRKPLLIISGIIMCISNAAMGCAFYLNEHGNNDFGYLPLVSLIVFMIGYSIGFGCIPYLLMGEIFPSPQRSMLSSISGSANLGIMFLVIKTYHPMEEMITTAGTFWVYSILCILGVLFVVILVPETKGQDLDHIAKLFLKKEAVKVSESSRTADGDTTKSVGNCDTSVEIRSSIDGNLATIMVGLVQLVSNMASLLFVDKSRRKPFLIISGIIMCISNAVMGGAFYLNEHGNNDFGYLPLVSLIVFMIGYSIGFGCIPYLLMGEIFPSPQRSMLSSISGSANLGIMFLVIKTYHPMEEMITTAGTFWVYSILCILGVLFVVILVPETKGQDLDNIAKLFLKKETVKVSESSRAADGDTTKSMDNCDKSVEISKM